MDLRVYFDEGCLAHENYPGHPERPERILAVVRRIRQTDYGVRLEFTAPAPVTRSVLERVHSPDHVTRVERSALSPRTVFDADTGANAHSYRAALLGAGGAVAAVRAAVAGDDEYGFVAMRPPGHHAEADRAMGFCLFNNAAIAAADAIAAGLERVAVVDWDVHHGNGTQHIFEHRSDVLYVSLHQYPHYPGTGLAREIGFGAGAGYTVNIALPAGSGGAEYRSAFSRVVVPVLEQYRPQLIIVSAGFDAHERDPLAGMRLDCSSWVFMTEQLVGVAGHSGGRRLVHLLEGGYDLDALADGADAVLTTLAGNARDSGGAMDRASESARASIEGTRSALTGHWRLSD